MNGRAVQPIGRVDTARDARFLQGFRIATFAALLLFLNLQGDGFPLGQNQTHRQLLLIPFTLVFCALLGSLLWPGAIVHRITLRWPETFASGKPILGLAGVFVVLAALLFIAEAKYYARFGYHLHKPAVGLVFGGVLALVLSNVSRRMASSGRYLFASVMTAYTAAYLLSIWSFPLSAWRSDMLPLIQQACTSLVDHHDPYRFYTLPNETIFLTYLPGTVLAFLPTVLVHLDPRFADLLYVAALALILYQAVRREHRWAAAALLSLFLLSPYLIYRHEIYTEPHWLSVVACLLLAHRRRWIAAALIFGVSVSLSQFSWVLFPFFMLFALEGCGLGSALALGAATILAGSLVTLPFLVWSPHAFSYGVLTHWQSIAINARPVNFSYWTARLLGGTSHLQLVQFILLSGIFVYCAYNRSCATLTGCLRWMSVALATFILLNLLIWGYFFLLLELLLLLHILSANDWLAEPLDLTRGENLEAGA